MQSIFLPMRSVMSVVCVSSCLLIHDAVALCLRIESLLAFAHPCRHIVALLGILAIYKGALQSHIDTTWLQRSILLDGNTSATNKHDAQTCCEYEIMKHLPVSGATLQAPWKSTPPPDRTFSIHTRETQLTSVTLNHAAPHPRSAFALPPHCQPPYPLEQNLNPT